LIKAFNQLLDNNKNVCLCILGYDGSLNQSYLLECEQLNKYPEKIKFVGRKENIADYLLHSDALCLTSTYEGLGIVVLEAFSMGIPVLSTPSGGPSEIIVNGYNGYVSNKISIESYVNILNKFIENPLRNKKEIVDLYQKKFSMNTCAARYLKLYKKIINEE
jgi:glycosyltransferase involved in cell wall biosynthesis